MQTESWCVVLNSEKFFNLLVGFGAGVTSAASTRRHHRLAEVTYHNIFRSTPATTRSSEHKRRAQAPIQLFRSSTTCPR